MCVKLVGDRPRSAANRRRRRSRTRCTKLVLGSGVRSLVVGRRGDFQRGPSSDRCADQLAVIVYGVAALLDSCDSSDGPAEEIGDIRILSKQYRHRNYCLYLLFTTLCIVCFSWCMLPSLYQR